MSNSRVGPYEIIRKLGEGGMGEVYLARDLRLRRRVALKTLSHRKPPTAEARRRLMHEARAAAYLNHPGIASIYDVLEIGEQVHIVMEYVPGEALSSETLRAPRSPGRVLELGLQLAEALAVAHAAGVVHGDLKPANVALSEGGSPKILDFGLARTHAVHTGDTGESAFATPSASWPDQPGVVVGTPGYMAPELHEGAPASERTDLYALGVILYELLTGRRPTRSAAGGGAGRASAQRGPDVSDRLLAVVAREVEPDPPRRWPSADALLRALRSVQAELVAHTVSEETTPPPRSGWGRRGRLAASAVAAAGVVAILIPGGPPVERVEGGPGRAWPVIAVLPLHGVSPDDSAWELGVGIADVLVAALSKIPEADVISRSATLRYRERDQALPEIARALGADLLVDGVVQRVRDDVRVSLSVVDVVAGRVVWSDTYDARYEEIFALQRGVSRAVVQALQLKLAASTKLGLIAPPTQSIEAIALYARARSLIDRPDVAGNLGRAVAMLEEATERDPDFALAFAALAEAHWARYAHEGVAAAVAAAEAATTMALRLDPALPEVRYTRALHLGGLGRFDEAIEEMERLIESRPHFSRAHRGLGDLLVDSGRAGEALIHLERALALRPALPDNSDSLGFALYRLGRFDAAVEAYRRSTLLEPDNAWPHQMLGASLQALGRRDEAAESYRTAIELGPDPKAWSNLGTLYYEDGRLGDAARAFEQAVKLAPTSEVGHRNLGDVYRRLGRAGEAREAYAEAAALCERSLSVNPRDAVRLGQLAVYEAKLGRGADARARVAEAVRLAPASAEAAYRQAVVEALVGRREAALVALERALQLGYSTAFAGSDEDLDALRSSGALRALLDRFREEPDETTRVS